LTRSPGEKHVQAGVELARWDGRTTQGWGHLAGEVDAVVNLAGANIGEKRWTEARKQIIRTSRKEAGGAIVEAIQSSPRRPRVVVQIAGIGIYGPHGNEVLTEEASLGDDFQASVVIDWENSTRPVADQGVRLVTMRTAPVLFRKGGMIDPFLLQFRLFGGGPLGSGRQWISWIHIQDLTRCIVYFLEHEETRGIYNVTSPEPVTNAQFGRTLGKVIKRPYWAPVPAFMLRLVLGEMSTLVLDGQRVVPRRLLDEGFQFEFASLRSALEDLVG
jgi:uncharacterized protein (TIGR01777 family)